MTLSSTPSSSGGTGRRSRRKSDSRRAIEIAPLTPRVEHLHELGVHSHAPRLTAVKAVAMGLDALAVGLAALIAYLAKSASVEDDPVSLLRYQWFGLAGAVAFVAIAVRLRLYQERFLTRRIDELRRIVRAAAFTIAAIALAGFAAQTYLARSFLLIMFVAVLVIVAVEREIVRRWFTRQRDRGKLQRPVVIVGSNTESRHIEHILSAEPSHGYRVVGVVDDTAAPDVVDRVMDAIDRTGATTVLLVATALDLGSSGELIRRLTEAGVHVELTTALTGISSDRLTMRVIGRQPVLYIEPVRRRGWRSGAKRAFDATLASVTLIVTAPVLLVAAIAIKIDSPGPVLFRQVRVGRHGELFEVVKLRTMCRDAESLLVDLRDRNEADGPLFKMSDDPRVTRVGRVLRALSIDELPQLWNVIRNEMSLVGPRPALPDEIEGWTPELFNRLRVKPGMTGMWQVSGRSTTTFAEYTELDLYYVDNWSLLIDLSILFKTVPVVLARRGAA